MLDHYVKRAMPQSSFWEGRFLPLWLPALLGLAFGLIAAALIARETLIPLIPLALTIPAVIIFPRRPFIAIPLWVLIFPYVVHDPTSGGRVMYTLLHRAMIPTALALAVLADWLRVHKRPPVRFGRAELAMAIFLLLVLANIVLLTPKPLQSLVRFYDRLFAPFCMYWLVRLSAPNERDLRMLIWVGFVTVIAQVIIGLLSWFMPQTLPEQWLNRIGERTVGTLSSPAVYTSTLLFFALLLLQYGLQSGSRLVRIVAMATIGLAFFGVFFSFSRGSWLGGAIVFAGLLLIYPHYIARMAATLLIVGSLLGPIILAEQLSWATTRLHDEHTAQGRVVGAATTIGMIRERPWFGWGFDTYDLYDERFKTRVANLAVRQEETSHNTYLLIIAELGVIGLLIYALPTIWWLTLSVRVRWRLPRSGPQSWQLLALLWLLLLDHFVVSNFMDMIQANLFGTTIWWLALGLVANLVAPHLQPGDIGSPRWVA